MVSFILGCDEQIQGETQKLPESPQQTQSGTADTPDNLPESSTLYPLCVKSSLPKTCLAIAKQDPEYCKLTEEVELCFEELAMIKKDPELCDGIELEGRDVSCRYSVEISIKMESISFCSSTVVDPSKCYREFAVKLDDPGVCDKVTHLKQRCLAVANADPEMCTNADYPSECLNEVYKRLSVLKKDTSYCDKMEVEFTDRDSWGCYWDVAVAAEDPSICDNNIFPSLCKGFVASELKLPDVCDEIESETTQKRCYYDVVVGLVKSSEASQKPSETENQECIRKEPTIIINPDSQEITAGDTATYSVSVTNNDNTQCKQSDFKILEYSSLTAISAITDEFGDNRLQPINPGDSVTFEVYVSTNSKAPSRSYSFTVSATNSKAASYSRDVQATVSLK